MDFFSHFLLGLLLSALTLNTFDIWIVYFASVMAIFPDLDTFLDLIPKIKNSILFSHKGVSNSYFSALIVSTVVGFLSSIIYDNNFMLMWMIGFLFYSMHVTIDFLTASKIPLFYPFSKKKFRFFIDRAVNPLLAIISIIVAIIYNILLHFSGFIISIGLTMLFFSFYLFYLLFKFITKVWSLIYLPKNCRYIPGFVPFFYNIHETIVSGEVISYKLTKKFLFSSMNEIVIESKIQANSKSKRFYLKALQKSSKYVFFSKWEFLIPIVQEDETMIKVYLFLAESYAKGRAYSLRIFFNKHTSEVMEESEDFNFHMIYKRKKK